MRRAAYVASNVAKNALAPLLAGVRRSRGRYGMDGDLDEVCAVLDRLAPTLAALGVDLAGKRVLELGVGRTPEICAAMLLAGAAEAHGVDVRLRLDGAACGRRYEALAARLAGGDGGAFLASVGSDGATLARRAANLGCGAWPLRFDSYAGERLPLPDAAVDVVLSKSVLEHVRRRAVRPLLADLRRVLRPGGVMVHIVDLRDHMHIDGDDEVHGDWLDALRYSEPLFRAMFANRSTYINRLRLGEWRSALAQAGFAVEVEQLKRFDLPSGFDVRRLPARYGAMPEAELRVGYVTFGARR